jgi:membrane protease YdiL (CAAX protease family)
VTEPEWDHPPVTLDRVAILVALGLPGVVAYLAALGSERDALAAQAGLAPDNLLILAAVQSLVLLVVAVAAGHYAAPRMGFTSRVMDRRNYGTEIGPGLRADLLPAAVTGAALGALLVAASRRALPGTPRPQALGADALVGALPLRILYGGVVEELLLRWGVLTVVALGLTVLVHRRRTDPSGPVVAAAVVLAALLFGLGHLPAAAATYGTLTPAVTVYVVGGNAVAGLALGWLFHRQSLEAAMMAHALAHVVLVAAVVLGIP